MKAYDLATALQNPTAVTSLHLQQRGLTTVPEQLFRMTNLEEVDLSYNRLTALPRRLLLLPKLRSLSLAFNELEAFPAEILQATQLEVLILSGNPLKKLPGGLLLLSKLRKLILVQVGVNDLPDDWSSLQKLQEVNLSKNHFGAFPPPLLSLPNLRRLDLSSNRLKQLPAAVLDLPRLTHLDLAKNRLKAWPTKSPTAPLEVLNLSNNKLQQLPPAFGQLQALRRLDLSHNQLSTLPDTFHSCQGLRQLALHHNQFQKIPEPLQQLSRLEKLNISHNNIQSWTSEDLPWPYLFELNLAYNPLESLPEGLTNCHQLRRLNIKGHRLSNQPSVLLKLPLLEKIAGLKEGPAVLRFRKAAQKKGLSAQEIPLFFDMYQGRATAQLSLLALIRALNFPLPTVRATAQEIWRTQYIPVSTPPLPEGSRLLVLGKLPFDLPQLLKMLKDIGVEVVKKPGSKATHLLLGPLPGDFVQDFQASQWQVLSTAQISEHLQERHSGFLWKGVDAQALQNVQHLLTTSNASSLRMAVRLLESGGVPASLLPVLLLAHCKTEDRNLKRELKSLLWLGASRSEQDFLEALFRLPVPVWTLERLTDMAAGTSFDIKGIWEDLKS